VTSFDALQLTGRTATHVVEVAEFSLCLHPDAAAALDALCRSARRRGLDPWPVSGFRSFERQLAIWNGKFRGERPLFDREGRPLRARDLDVAARVAAILCWSALPGASRHHWGTDIDLVDRGALTAGRSPQLQAAEYEAGGPFERLSTWLEGHAGRFGFYRPYRRDRGGVAPEPWHFSFAPRAREAQAALTPALLREALSSATIDGRDCVLAQLASLHRRYVTEVDRPPRMRSRWVRCGR